MEDYESYYRPPPLGIEDGVSSEPPHSGLGIASFAVGILSGMAGLTAVAMSGFGIVLASRGVEPELGWFMGTGFATLGGLGLAFVGLALAVAALCQSNRKKVFGVLGLTFNLFVLLGVCGLMGLGLAVG